MPEHASELAKLDELLAKWSEGNELGQPESVAQLCCDCPELVSKLEQNIEWQKQMDRLLSSVQPGNESTLAQETVDSLPHEAPPAFDSTLDHRSQPALWPEIEGYEIQTLLGEGGMGSVYRAREIRLNRLVALKVIRASPDSPKQRARFEVEAQAVAKMQHPNIVQIFAIGKWQPPGGSPLLYLAFEYLSGGDLEKHVARRPVPSLEAARLVRTLALAIDHAHRKGIIHRDLKPSNILMQPDLEQTPSAADSEVSFAGYTPKVADFGLARQQVPDAKLTQAGTVMGTAAYMAPEQAEGLEVGPPADIYALGAILYQLLTARAPIEAKSPGDLLYCVCHRPPVKPRKHVRGVPVALEAICLRCLAKKPSDRYPNAAALAADLERFITGPTTTTVWPVSPVGWPWRWVAAGVAALLVIGALAAGWFLNLPGDKTLSGERPAGKSTPQSPSGIEIPLRLQPISVDYYRLSEDKQQAVSVRRMGDGATEARFDDAVVLSIKQDEPLYCYVLGYAADGEEQLLWPCDGQSAGTPDVAPPRVSEIPRLPVGDKQFRLDEEPEGGLQVYVLAASRAALPAYAEWRRKLRKPVTWKRQTGFTGVWQANGVGTHRVVKGQAQERSVQPAVGVPPLGRLCQELKSGGVEAVEAIAFPVVGKRGQNDKTSR
jgi:serine/threonine protein kinase